MAKSSKASKDSKSSGKKRGKKKGIRVDFDGVESGGRSIGDGWAHLLLKEAEHKESESGNEMIAAKFEATRGKEKATVFDNFVLVPQSLWKLRTFLEASGVEVPDGEMDIDLSDLVGLECEGEIVNEEYDGRDRPRLVSFRAEGAEDDDGEEEEEEEEEEESEDDDSEEESEDDDSEEEEEEEEDEDEEEPPKKKGKDKGGKKSKSKFRVGQKVKFKDDDSGKTVKGVITSLDDDQAMVEDSDGEEWELDVSELKAV